MSISGVSPIMFQHIKKWRLYQEADNVLGTVYTIQLSAVYHSRSIIVTFKDVSAVTIRDMETLTDLSDGFLNIKTQPQGMCLVEEWEEQTFRFYCRQYEVTEVE
ncbi:hypothetical protein [Bacillus atrophaeus]|uniref:hypothetical protein n=1 Tax=Bacillus atrophaeus TaxID=1452 RepID=UPI001CB94DFC|nr:hypothetical protein [Bacillus atrophaeus]MED1017237.1 hypothetical protein [Bacillus atrophaeus]MED1032282.1 hypothetical protein [Bacillus atrophaeus]MED1119420.1 hypothetical protein [Bacillus atrophaeus]MED1130344.1 hypothetical protein [Bacillus atrophaeus]